MKVRFWHLKNSYSLYPQIRIIPMSILWIFDPKSAFLDPPSNKFHNRPDTIGSSSESSSHACCGLFSLASQFSTNSVQCNLMCCVVQCVPSWQPCAVVLTMYIVLKLRVNNVWVWQKFFNTSIIRVWQQWGGQLFIYKCKK